jgi:hypothetical protein
MERSRTLQRGALASVALTVACATNSYSNGLGSTTVDGSDAESHKLPPVGAQCYPRYRVHDGYVYDVYGHYYKEHNGEWSVLRSAPHEIRHERPEVSGQSGCAGVAAPQAPAW